MGGIKKFSIFLIILITPVFTFAAPSRAEIKKKMVQDLDVIQQAFEVKYAPKEWKKRYNQWDLHKEIKKAKKKIESNKKITLKDYQHIVRDFFNSTTDYHVGVHFYSTEMAILPFRMHSANGKYYIAWSYPDLSYDLQKGDEVVLINGRPTDEVVKEFKLQEFGNPDSQTDQALAEAIFTARSGSRGYRIPQGEIMLTVRHGGTNEVTEESLEWIYFPEEISSSWIDHPKKKKHLVKKGELGKHPIFKKDMSASFFKAYAKDQERVKLAMEADDDTFIGSKLGPLPNLGNVVWEAPLDFSYRAYIYEGEQGKKIGYVRIPNFLADIYEIEQFLEVIAQFEAQTDALVLDQLHNPGGSMFYMYGVASILTDRPLVVPKQRVMLTQEDVVGAIEILEAIEFVETEEQAQQIFGEDIGGFPVDLELIQKLGNYFYFVISEWEEGNTFTEMNYLYGIDVIQPHPVAHYTKPIVMLVNHLDFSCGDFLPAILQDNKRVTILGTQTAGAGGYVMSESFPNHFGIAGFNYTGSIAERMDHNPIENLGITPDIKVEFTERDLESNYQDFTSAINKAIGFFS